MLANLSLLMFPIILVMILLSFFVVVFWIWALIDCLASRLTVAEKILWIVIIVFFHFIGALLYYIFKGVQSKEVKMVKKGKKLLRSKNRMIAGVCAGIAEYFDIDPTVIRLVWVILIFLSLGSAILAYIIAWIIIPER